METQDEIKEMLGGDIGVYPYTHDLTNRYLGDKPNSAFGVIGHHLGVVQSAAKDGMEALQTLGTNAGKLDQQKISGQIEHALKIKETKELVRWNRFNEGIMMRSIPCDCSCCS
jgi:hypothetical protein